MKYFIDEDTTFDLTHYAKFQVTNIGFDGKKLRQNYSQLQALSTDSRSGAQEGEGATIVKGEVLFEGLTRDCRQIKSIIDNFLAGEAISITKSRLESEIEKEAKLAEEAKTLAEEEESV